MVRGVVAGHPLSLSYHTYLEVIRKYLHFKSFISYVSLCLQMRLIDTSKSLLFHSTFYQLPQQQNKKVSKNILSFKENTKLNKNVQCLEPYSYSPLFFTTAML